MPEVPAFDIPDDHVLQAQWWLSSLTGLGPRGTLGGLRITPDRERDRARVHTRITHWSQRGLRGAVVDELAFPWPRHDGRAGDLVGAALTLARARRDVAPIAAMVGHDELAALVGMARRAPGWTAHEREVLERVEHVLDG